MNLAFHARWNLATCTAALALLSWSSARGAATFIVDGSSAACSDSGSGSVVQPYCTISAALRDRGGPGVTIAVRPGIYREQVSVPASGAAGSPLVIQAAAGGVVVDGADDFGSASQWASFSGDVWLASSVTWSPNQVFLDGARIDSSSSAPGSLAPRTYRWVSGSGLYVNSGGGSPDARRARVGHRNYGFALSSRSWVVVDGFTVTGTEDRGIHLSGSCSNVTVSHDTVSFANKMGIYTTGASAIVIRSNMVHDCNHHGIALTAGTTGCTVEDNESFRNAVPGVRSANGIYLYGSPGNVLRRNRTHDNQDTGIDFQPGSNDCVSYLNQSWHNGDHGFDHLRSTGTIHACDVAFGNYREGFSIEGHSSGTQLHNCIVVDNGLTTSEVDLLIDTTSTAGFVSDYNILWNSSSPRVVKYGLDFYTSVALYAAASGQDAHTLQSDPRFIDGAAGDFHLRPGSAAIDDGDSGAPDWPENDADGLARADDPATPNTGVGPVNDSDRGAYEYQPGVNPPPVARLTVTPSAGRAPLAVVADGSASTAAGGTIVSYRFDFGDGTIVGPQSPAIASHTYAAGTWSCRLTVTDDRGASASTVVEVAAAAAQAGADEIHWTFTGPTSVTFDWRGADPTIRYGLTTGYGLSVTAVAPSPMPFSSSGPFWEARLTGLRPGTVYHYSIGKAPDHCFRTMPAAGENFVVYVEGDIGDTSNYSRVGAVQSLIARGAPAFVLGVGDLTYGNANGQAAVDNHFNNVMDWALEAAYMPAWGNHEWDSSGDDLRNYKGRFDLPNPQTSPGAPVAGCCGEDWYWFDCGGVRFIAYPEPFTSATWPDWATRVRALMDAAQADPTIRIIVTFGHRPALSSGWHPGDPGLLASLLSLGASHSKYVLTLNGHSHNYERSVPQSGITLVTAGIGGSSLEQANGPCPWPGGCPAPPWCAFRALHHGALRLRFGQASILGDAICGPPGSPGGSNANDITCAPGDTLDSFTIGEDLPPVPAAPATVTANEETRLDVPVKVADRDGDPILALVADLSALPQRNDARFTADPGDSTGLLTWTPRHDEAGSYTVTFRAANRMAGVTTTTLRVLPGGQKALALKSVGPNPASSTLSVAYSLATWDPARIELLDSAGRLLVRHDLGAPGPGQYDRDFPEPGSVRPGVYRLRLIQAGRIATTRVVLLR